MKKVIYSAISFLPTLAFAVAAPTTNLGFLTTLVNQIGSAIKALIPVIFGLAIIYFFWGLVQYIRSAGDPKKASEGKSIMIYGIIAIAVMVSVYGLVAWLQGAVGITAGQNNVVIPEVPGLVNTN